MPTVAWKLGPIVLAGLFALSEAPRVCADDDPTVVRGVQYLRGHAGGSQIGETALIALAMLKADVPADDPALAGCISKLRARFASGGYKPERSGGTDVYEAGVVGLALANIPGGSQRAELNAVARYLISQQKTNGSWDYAARTAGDTSISQYAVLGLWEAENGGALVPPEVWERAATWYMSSQAPGGSWNYHRDEAGPSNPETLSMTAAGVGSLLICERQLARYRRNSEISDLLIPLNPESQRLRHKVSLPAARVEAAIRRGLAWLGSNFTTGTGEIVGHSPYYGLYGIERIGALANRDTLGRVDWFEQGRRFIRGTQRPDGGWAASYGDVPNTVWAILFVTRSTAKTLARIDIKPLGAGTLLGGRGLPKDLSSLTVAGGRVVSRPMSGAVEGMLAVLEDPRSLGADAALSGLVSRYRAEGPAVLRPLKDRLRALLSDRDLGLRRVAAWALARTGEIDVVPNLIGGLTDPDESVVTLAREGLQLLSRKADGLGPPSPSTPEQRLEAAQRWRAWYATIKPLDVEGQDVDEAATAGAGGAR
jgi:hypothetical protein